MLTKVRVRFRAGLAASFTMAFVALGTPIAHAQETTRVSIETDLGNIVVELFDQQAPRTVANFLLYVDRGLYEGGSFYRTVRADNQPDDTVQITVIQGGINRTRRADALAPIRLEPTGTTGIGHLDGTISMARNGPDSARGEFFICIGDQPELDEGGTRNPDGRGFAAFGRVVEGGETVRRIHERASDGQRLAAPVGIVQIVVLDGAEPSRY